MSEGTNMPLTREQRAEKEQLRAYYERIIQKMPAASPFNVNAHLKLAQLYMELGEIPAALQEYALAADVYTNAGEVVKAIAVRKIAERLDTQQPPISSELSMMYFHPGHARAQTGRARPVQPPESGLSAPSSALTQILTPDEFDHAEEGEIASFLKHHPLLACLSWAERQWVEEHVRVSHFAQHDVILRPTHEQEALFLVMEGEVRVVRQHQHEELLLAKFGRPGFFGEISLLTMRRSGATVIAESNCSVLEISRTVFATLVKTHPTLIVTLRASATQRALDSKLAHIPLFTDLSTPERQKIVEFLAPVAVKKGAAIVTEGESGDCMYLIQSGTVGVYTKLMLDHHGSPPEAFDADEQLHLATLQDGDFFGEQALITNQRRNATVIALTDTQLLRFARADLDAVVRAFPRIGQLLKQYHYQRTTATLESLHTAFQQKETQMFASET